MRRPGSLAPIAPFALVMAIGAVAVGEAGCSTLETEPLPECKDDTDCGTGLVCSLDSNTCVPEALPPRQVLGFDIVEGAGVLEVHTEILACDPEVSRELGGSELRVVKKSSLFETLSVSVDEVEAVLNSCAISSCEGGVCDDDAMTCTTPLDAEVSLRINSRLGLDPVTSPSLPFVTETEPPLEEGELPPPVDFSWPSYATSDPASFPATQLQVVPAEESPTRGEYRFALGADAGTSLVATGLDRCMRGIIGPEGSVRTVSGTAVADASVQFVYDEPVASPSTVLGTGPSCTNDEDCEAGWACDTAAQRCGLDLTGALAGQSLSRDDPAGSFATAYLYTYCADFESDDDSLERLFRIRVKPPDTLGYPTMEYELLQAFPPKQPATLGEVNLENGLCLPAWAEPKPIGFSLSGSPVTLLDGDLGTYTCCSTSCLEEPGGSQADTCANFDAVGFETLWFNEDPISWAFSNCLTTAGPGRFFRTVSSADEACTAEGCTIDLTPGDTDAEESRLYTVSIEQPPESVFRSQRFTVTMTSETESFPTFELEPRVLIRGSVGCASAGCNFTNAVVSAEQIRTDTPDSEISGPYFFETRVDETGAFVLPVDPGVYVMTAYPAISEPGAPAPYRVIDLREDSPDLSSIDGVPTVSLSPFELEDGVLVRVLLRDFGFSTKVSPIDRGSWAYQDEFPPEVDLNDPQTCLTSSTRGCTIRRIRPTDTPLPLLLAGQFQFTARDRGPESCPE